MKHNSSVRVGKFAIIGIILALFNFAIYTFLARVIFNSNELLWFDSIIAYALSTILAYILHSKITWKERPVTKRGIIMFFLWNGITAIAISPLFTWLFSLITPLYEFIHNICTNLHIPFDYNFVESTGIFCLTTCVTMILNYLFYDKLVFGTSKNVPETYSAHEKTYSDQEKSYSEDNKSYSAHTPDAKVSVIVPIYNTAKYLPTCLDSILNQTHKNLEIILVDDGSTDTSGQIADDYAKKDSRIKVIHQKNQGQSAARNVGLKKAKGEYISFIDSDDQIKPSFLNTLLDLYTNDKKTSIAVCGHQYRRVKSNSSKNLYQSELQPRYSHESQKAYILKLLAKDGRMYSCNNKLFQSHIIKQHHVLFDEKLKFSEDTNFVLDYLNYAKGEITYTPKPLYIYNFGTESSTVKTSSTIWNNWQNAYKNLQTWLGPHPTAQEKFWLHLVHLRWRISHFRSKRRAKQNA